MSSQDSLDLVALRRWLDHHLPEQTGGALTARLIAGGRSNPTYELSDGTREWILRRPPHGHVLPTAHDMRREHRVLDALAGTAVPVPGVVGPSADADVIGVPFYVMDKLPGITLRTRADAARLSPERRRSLAHTMVDALAVLHEVDPAEVGLGDFGRPAGYLDRQLDRWRRQWEASATSPRPEVDELLHRLARHRPTTRRSGIVHGDFKLDNIMVDVDGSRILGVLDWEMSTLGDTDADLGTLCSFWDEPGEPEHPITAGSTAIQGFPSREELVERYAFVRGIDVPDISWYRAFADVKTAVILEGIHARHRSGLTVGEGFDGVGEMVGTLLDRALDLTATYS
ncbi:phosphotransferase family protein [Aeromicrobium sp. CTD01-1L150]|uniref:phosphotransferase family protein n=1 Tax=Aeromicrobium sp. CTD01-1L150 TaxID=3341830 RepID=UPI0035C02B1A